MNPFQVNRFLLWFVGINTFENDYVWPKIISKLLLIINLGCNLSSLLNHLYRYRSFAFGEGVLIIVTIRPITCLAIICYFLRKKHQINCLMKFAECRIKLSNEQLLHQRIVHLTIILTIMFIFHPITKIYLILSSPLKYWYDLFGLAKSGKMNKWLVTLIYLIRTTFIDFMPIITSVHVYCSIYFAIQANYGNNHLANSEGLQMCATINEMKKQRLMVNIMMIYLEDNLSFLPFIWIFFLFIFTSLEIAFYALVNSKGIIIFVAYAMPRCVSSIVFVYCLSFIVHTIEEENKLLKQLAEQYSLLLGMDNIGLHQIDCGLYLSIDEPIQPTAWKFFLIQKKVFLPFIGSSISFFILFRNLFEFEFRKILASIANELNVTTVIK